MANVPEGENRVVEISIHPNPRCWRKWVHGSAASRPSRDTRLHRVMLRSGGRGRYYSLRSLAHPPSLPRSNRCKFHYWPTDSAALNAATRVYRLLSAFIRSSKRRLSLSSLVVSPTEWKEYSGCYVMGKIEKNRFYQVPFHRYLRAEKKERKRMIYGLCIRKKRVMRGRYA